MCLASEITRSPAFPFPGSMTGFFSILLLGLVYQGCSGNVLEGDGVGGVRCRNNHRLPFNPEEIADYFPPPILWGGEPHLNLPPGKPGEVFPLPHAPVQAWGGDLEDIGLGNCVLGIKNITKLPAHSGAIFHRDSPLLVDEKAENPAPPLSAIFEIDQLEPLVPQQGIGYLLNPPLHPFPDLFIHTQKKMGLQPTSFRRLDYNVI
jgi:hypothetical protein